MTEHVVIGELEDQGRYNRLLMEYTQLKGHGYDVEHYRSLHEMTELIGYHAAADELEKHVQKQRQKNQAKVEESSASLLPRSRDKPHATSSQANSPEATDGPSQSRSPSKYPVSTPAEPLPLVSMMRQSSKLPATPTSLPPPAAGVMAKAGTEAALSLLQAQAEHAAQMGALEDQENLQRFHRLLMEYTQLKGHSAEHYQGLSEMSGFAEVGYGAAADELEKHVQKQRAKSAKKGKPSAPTSPTSPMAPMPSAPLSPQKMAKLHKAASTIEPATPSTRTQHGTQSPSAKPKKKTPPSASHSPPVATGGVTDRGGGSGGTKRGGGDKGASRASSAKGRPSSIRAPLDSKSGGQLSRGQASQRGGQASQRGLPSSKASAEDLKTGGGKGTALKEPPPSAHRAKRASR